MRERSANSAPQTDPRQSTDEAFRLRAEPPRVMRLSRKVLALLMLIACLGISGALIFALQSRQEGGLQDELFSTENRPTADALQELPADYAGIPQLGPALPGDLGGPILRAREEGKPIPASPLPGPDPAEERRLAEIEAARTSALFFDTQSAETVPLGDLPVDGPQTGRYGMPEATPEDSRTAFLDAPTDRQTVTPDRLADPASPFILQAGTIIPAALITGIRSDLPGQITAQVTENVYDSPTGRYLLIPQGARLIGEYDSGISAGQRRVLLVWTRLILPDGSSLVLERLQGTDASGYAGLEDRVDRHWWGLAQAAALSTLLNIGAELATDESDSIATALRDGAQDTVGSAAEEIVRQQLAIPPTLTIRPGFQLRVIVTRDLIFEPYGR
ncbi:MAG: TrbI/VirB10 family protein [Tabrizicola sp.]|nr:TrbI/VirB10 family protein [Tabrizicola sp.]